LGTPLQLHARFQEGVTLRLTICAIVTYMHIPLDPNASQEDLGDDLMPELLPENVVVFPNPVAIDTRLEQFNRRVKEEEDART